MVEATSSKVADRLLSIANGWVKRKTNKSGNSLSERNTEKPVVIRGQLARRVHQTAENLPIILEISPYLDMKAYPRESKETTW